MLTYEGLAYLSMVVLVLGLRTREEGRAHAVVALAMSQILTNVTVKNNVTIVTTTRYALSVLGTNLVKEPTNLMLKNHTQ